MKRAFPLLFLLVCATGARSQYGYLGARNVVSVGINDRLWSDAWSLSFFRGVGRIGGLRVDARLLSVNRDLQYLGDGWLGINDEAKLGTVTGKGFGIGVHYSVTAGGGLSQPLGYYMSMGLEYTGGTTQEKIDPRFIDPDWSPYGNGPIHDFDYDHTVVRLVYDWGIRKVLAERFSLDLGIELGYLMYHSIKTKDDLKGAGYSLGFERNVLVRFEDKYDSDAAFMSTTPNKGMSITLTPMARLGVLF